MKPKISFILAAYNEEKNIVECVESCLNQTYDNIEVCITDDGSTDKTWQILQTLESDKVKIKKFDKNKGKVFAFNSSYQMSTGDYLAIIGADDVNLDHRIQNQLDFLNEHQLDLTWGGFIHIDIHGNELPNYKTPLKPNPKKIDILQDNFIPGNTVFFKRELAGKIFPIPENLKFEDWWISFNTIFSYKYKIINKPVIKYRIHENNTVGNQAKGYIHNRRKNILRHLAYHDAFHNKLTHQKSLQNINQLVKLYKMACLEDSLRKRITLFLSATPKMSLLGIKVIIKFFIVTILGLKGAAFILRK